MKHITIEENIIRQSKVLVCTINALGVSLTKEDGNRRPMNEVLDDICEKWTSYKCHGTNNCITCKHAETIFEDGEYINICMINGKNIQKEQTKYSCRVYEKKTKNDKDESDVDDVDWIDSI